MAVRRNNLRIGIERISCEYENDDKKYFSTLGERGTAKNSDHYYFSEKGVPSFFFYTMGGIKAYHDIYDKAATLPLTKFKETFGLIRDFTDAL